MVAAAGLAGPAVGVDEAGDELGPQPLRLDDGVHDQVGAHPQQVDVGLLLGRAGGDERGALLVVLTLVVVNLG